MGKPTRGNQKGAQRHAEGQQGDKTRRALSDQGSDRDEDDSRSKRAENDPGRSPEGDAALHEKLAHEGSDGRHRLVEGREQHDEADMKSEKNRQDRDTDRHHHHEGDLPRPGQGEGRG